MESKRVSDFVKSAQTGLAVGERCSLGVKQLRMNSLTRNGSLDLDGAVYIPENVVSERYTLEPNDILFNNTNSFELVGQTAIFLGNDEITSFSNHLTRVRLDHKKCLPDYFARWLHHKWESGRLKSITTRFVGQSSIATNELRHLKFDPPTLITQTRITALLNSVAATISQTQHLITQTQQTKKAIATDLITQPRRATEYQLGELFTERKEKGIEGVPTFSISRTQGLVERGSLNRRVESELTPSQHLLARKNDIAYNMMRMWQGVAGLAPYDGLVSPAYVVLAPTDKIDPLFASYLFKTPEVIRLFHRYSQGLTNDRLRLYYD